MDGEEGPAIIDDYDGTDWEAEQVLGEEREATRTKQRQLRTSMIHITCKFLVDKLPRFDPQRRGHLVRASENWLNDDIWRDGYKVELSERYVDRRAASCRGPRGWTRDGFRKANRELSMLGRRIDIMSPVHFDRRALAEVEMWKTPNGGVMTPCYHCKSNEFVEYEPAKSNVQRGAPRLVYGVECDVDEVIANFSCANVDCPAVQRKLAKHKAPPGGWTSRLIRGHGSRGKPRLTVLVNCGDIRVFETMPLEVQLRYRTVRLPKSAFTRSLLRCALLNEGTTAEGHRQLRQKREETCQMLQEGEHLGQLR